MGKKSSWISFKTIIILGAVVALLFALRGTIPLHMVDLPSLGEGSTFHIEGITFDHYYTPFATGMGTGSYAQWDYSYMNGYFFHVTEALPMRMSTRSMTTRGFSIDPDPWDDGLPNLNLDISSMGVVETEVIPFVQGYSLDQRLINSGAVVRTYRFQISFYTDSDGPPEASGLYNEFDGSWKDTTIWLHFATQRWPDPIYQQFGAGDVIETPDFTTFVSVKVIKAEVDSYEGGGHTGYVGKCKHDWTPIEGAVFSIYKVPDNLDEPFESCVLPSESKLRSSDRIRYIIQPQSEIMVPLIIENFGGYIEGAPYLWEMGDPQVTLTCDVTVVSTHQYLIREEGGGEVIPWEDWWLRIKQFIDKFLVTFGIFGVIILVIVAILVLRGLLR